MPIDFTKINVKSSGTLSTDPIDIFQKLKVNDQNINDLWLAQGDTLREWHENRNKKDIAIALNTGAGKTLIGLLVAQSLVNETRGKVLYCCSSIQLVEQTVDKANGYGIKTTKYFKGRFNNDLYTTGKAPCITTYHALFNGKSKFFKEDISAIIFDDAHTAENILRDNYSLIIKKEIFPDLYKQIFEIFKNYFINIGKYASYTEIETEVSYRLLFIPPFEIKKNINEINRLLLIGKLDDKNETRFSWEYIKDKVDLCALLITSNIITITPPFIPTQDLVYFGDNIRRIYLSATLVAPDSFARTFGKVPDKKISPDTSAGECERLILMPSRINTDIEDIELTKKAIINFKALILVPTYARSEKWEEYAIKPDTENITKVINNFKKSTDNSKLLLTARYDGVDFPGDSCRVMVIDDLPMGVGQLERFMWEFLRLSNSLKSTIASRIIQSFGRISRGLSDHGVVLITSEKLVDWLLTPQNAALLPNFLQKQILLGYEISNQLKNIIDIESSVNNCLARDDGWLSAYESNMHDLNIEKKEYDEHLTKNAIAESKYAFSMWNRDYKNAAKNLLETLTEWRNKRGRSDFSLCSR